MRTASQNDWAGATYATELIFANRSQAISSSLGAINIYLATL